MRPAHRTLTVVGACAVSIWVGAILVGATASADAAPRQTVPVAHSARDATAPPIFTQFTVAVQLSAPTAWVGGTALTGTVTITDGRNPIRVPGDVSYAVQLTTTGGSSVTTTDGCTFSAPYPCMVANVAAGASGAMQFVLNAASATSGTVTATVPQVSTLVSPPSAVATPPVVTFYPANGSASAPYRFLQAHVDLLSSVTAQGTAVVIHGTDLPPGAQVALGWNVGIADARIFTAAGAEAWWPAAIPPHDRLGLRQLTVSSSSFQALVTRGALLVVPPPSSPPRFFQR